MYPVLLSLGKTEIPTFLTCAALGYAIAVWLGLFLGPRLGVGRGDVAGAALTAGLASVLGAKLGHCLLEAPGHVLDDGAVLQTPWQLLAADPWHWTHLLDGGFVLYGGLIAGGAGLAAWCAGRRLRPGLVADAVAPGALLGLAVGRVGCFGAGCCHGAATTLPWAVTFPDGPGAGLGPVHPTQLYEAALTALMGAWLLRRWPRRRFEGELAALAIALYAAARFGLEALRGDPERQLYLGGALSTSQIISLLLLPLALGALWRGWARRAWPVRAGRDLARGWIAIVALALVLPTPGHAERLKSLVALPLEVVDVEADVAEGIEAMIAEACQGVDGYKLMAIPARVRENAATCQRENYGCLARATREARVDAVLAGELSSSVEGMQLDLYRLDPKHAVVVSHERVALAGGEDALRATIRHAVLRLVAPDQVTGSLELVCSEPHAVVQVDGEVIGTTPLLKPLQGLRVGPHQISVRKPGFREVVQEVEIEYATERRLEVELISLVAAPSPAFSLEDIDPVALLPQIWPWLVAGGGAVVIAGGGVCGMVVLSDTAEIERRAEAGVLVFPHDDGRLFRAQALAVTANLLYAAGAAGLVAGVGLGLWPWLEVLLASRAEEAS